MRKMGEIGLVYSGDLGKPGGGTDRISAFANGLSNEGHQVSLLISQPTGPLPKRIRHLETNVIPLQPKGVSNQLQRAILLIKKAKHLQKNRDLTLQVTHSPLAGIFAIFNEFNFVLDMHDLVFTSALYDRFPISNLVKKGMYFIEKQGVQAASRIVVVSEYMRKHLTVNWGIPDKKIRVIPNGYFKDIQRKYYIPYTERVNGRVVFLGMVHPKVDICSLREIAKLSDVNELIVIGDGPKYDELKSINESKLILTGRLPDPVAFDLVSRAELAINPQKQSLLQKASSPVKLFLYAGLGVPIVATSGPDIVNEYAQEGALKMVDSSNSITFSNAVETIMEDCQEREKMSRCAINASSSHTWSSRVDSLKNIYKNN